MSNASEQLAIVTGSAQGIGLGIAASLAERGYLVAIADVNVEGAKAASRALVEQGGKVFPVELDVSLAESWARCVREVTDRHGRIDVLVNHAGISPRGTVESTDEALWERTLAVNLKGPWLGIKAALPWLKRSRGAIINTGSTRATRPMPGLFSYITSKAGLLGLTRQVAVECLSDGVACNMVAPGWVDSPGERLIQAEHGRPNFPDDVRNLITPREIGETVAFLASPEGRRITGMILYVDAGLHIADDAGMVYLPTEDRPRYRASWKGSQAE